MNSTQCLQQDLLFFSGRTIPLIDASSYSYPLAMEQAVALDTLREEPPLPHWPRRLADGDPLLLASDADTLDGRGVHAGSSLPVRLPRQSESVVSIYRGRSSRFRKVEVGRCMDLWSISRMVWRE